MADFWFPYGLKAAFDGEVTTSNLRMVVCMSNNNIASNQNAATLSALTLDEYDGGSRPPAFGSRDQWDSVAFGVDFTGHFWMQITASDETLASLAAGTRSASKLLTYIHKTSDSDSIPLIAHDAVFTGNGGNIVLSVNANGLGYVDM